MSRLVPLIRFFAQLLVAIVLTTVALEGSSVVMAGILASSYGAPVLGGASPTGKLRNTEQVQKSGPGRGDVWNINRMGFRDGESKFWGTARTVWVFGDSFTEGHGLSEEETYSSKLQGLLDDAYGPGAWRVLRLAEAGAGIMLGGKIYEKGHKIKPPDVVVFAGVPLNEYMDALRDANANTTRHPLETAFSFPFSESLFRRIRREGRKVRWEAAGRAFLESFLSRLGNNEATQKKGGRAATPVKGKFPYEDDPRFKALSPAIKEKARNRDIHTYFLKKILDDPNLIREFTGRPTEQDLVAYKAQFDAVMRLIDADHVPLTVFVMVAGSFEVNCDHCEEFRELGMNLTGELGRVEESKAAKIKMRDLWLTRAQSLHSKVCVVDLVEVFMPIRQERLFQHYDGHIGPRGHEAWADAVFHIIFEADKDGKIEVPGLKCAGPIRPTETDGEKASAF